MVKRTDFKRSFVDWSQSELGFYVDQYWNDQTGEWIEGKWQPIVWHVRQERALRYLFTLTERGRLPHNRIYWIDIGKSAKSLLQAAVGQWMGMYHSRNAEVLLAANSKHQAGVRCFKAMADNLKNNPYRDQIVNVMEKGIVFLETGNTVRAIPLMANTQAGANFVFAGCDESWDYEGQAAEDFVAEVKPSPTRRNSIVMHTSYPPHTDSEALLGRTMDSFIDSRGYTLEGVRKVEGLEDLPLYVNSDGAAMWWNHEPYPWHLQIMESGLTFLEEQRRDTMTTEASYKRIWEAHRTTRSDQGMPIDVWDDCRDEDWVRLTPDDQGQVLCGGLDIGTRKTSALVFRGYDPATQRYPLMDHSIWTIGEHVTDEGELFKRLFQKLLDMHRSHYLVAVYYDPNQAAKLAADLEAEGVNMVRWTQNTRREEADRSYRNLIYRGILRNYRDCWDLRQHVMDAVWRETRSGLRMDKRTSTKDYDGAVADSGACLAVTENLEDMKKLQRRRRYRSSLATSVRPINPYAALYPSRRSR